MSRSQHIWLLLVVMIVIAIDQTTKYWAEHVLGPYSVVDILPIFDFSLAHNYGAAFGFLNKAGGWQTVFFTVLALVVSAVLCVFIRQLKHFERHLALAYSLVIAGALGNAIDRMVYGYVVDFIHFFYNDWHYPHFNVADMAICIGAFLLISEAFGFAFLNSKPDTQNG